MSLLETERDKYERMWNESSYSNWSPGEAAVGTFVGIVPWAQDDSLVDLGCGTGRAGLVLSKLGFNVTLLDFCQRAVQATHLPFVEACLWDLPFMRFDWIYCVDVLEHIPPEMVDQVLQQMAKITNKGGYLQIALFEDHCGKTIGETLHLTLESPEWWLAQIGKHWPVTYIKDSRDIRGNDGYAKFILGAPDGK